jgi:hypothetical protein
MLHRLRERHSAGKQTTFTVRGRDVDFDRLNRYLIRNPGLRARFDQGELPASSTASDVLTRTPSPEPTMAPQRVLSKGPYRMEEHVFASIKGYFVGSFESGRWVYNQDGFARSAGGMRGRQWLTKSKHQGPLFSPSTCLMHDKAVKENPLLALRFFVGCSGHRMLT